MKSRKVNFGKRKFSYFPRMARKKGTGFVSMIIKLIIVIGLIIAISFALKKIILG